ncbi:MAG: NAD(P)/FAD-dependent oxidoreductase [Actinomycetota bacterium]
MSSTTTSSPNLATDHVDVLIVGAGISGIGAAYWLNTLSPNKTWTILEGREDLGGTWDLFRYPGIRSDSDMYTLGYSFKPWTNPKAIADGPAILDYVRETAVEQGIDEHIRFSHRVERAEWDSGQGQWTVYARTGDEVVTLTCGFLFMCSGYYSYKSGYTPDFPGRERFGGPVIHPQEWPEDLEYAGKRVVIIGSGATAVTIVPAIADETEHVTMLQRSPTWMVARPDVDPVAQRLRKYLPERLAYAAIRRRNTWRGELVYNMSRTKPEKVREQLLGLSRQALGEEEVAKNFTPSYNPWDQRLCLMPNGDFYSSITDGKADVVTDTIESFTETGIQLTSGQHLDADIIVTATGLNLVTVGDMDFVVDGETVDFSETWTYRGIGYSGIPNMASTFGYINASWTLRADLVSRFVCRLLNHMDEQGTDVVTPMLRPSDRDMPVRPWIDDFSSGYMQRMMPLLPRQGDREPWTNPQRYAIERKELLRAPLDDGTLVFAATREMVDA